MNLLLPDPADAAETLAAAADALTGEELRHHLAVVAGLIAHREGNEAAASACCRIARGLRFPTEGRA